jgi:hypothetical protein
VLAQKPWLVPIPGTTKPHRLEENIAAAELELAPDDLRELDEGAAAITVSGARYAGAQQRMIDRRSLRPRPTVRPVPQTTRSEPESRSW